MTTATTIHGFTRQSVEELSRRKNEPSWMLERRMKAFQIFEALPMPSRTDEEWRRTDIRKLKLEDLQTYAPSSGTGLASPLGLEGGAYGGEVSQDNSETTGQELAANVAEAGVIFCSLDDAVRLHGDLVREFFMSRAVQPDSGKFAALNGAFWSGGVFVYVPKGVDVALPLRSLYGISAGGFVGSGHSLIVVEAGARLTYVEEYASQGLTGQSLSAGVIEAFVGQEAHLTLVTVQEYLGGVYDLNTQRALLDRDSSLDWLVIGLGDGLTKSNIDVALQGPGARTQMLGILWGYGRQHTDYHTLQDHQAPNCTSDLLYKGALTDESVSVFSGRIRVEKGAHRTDSYQANRTVILSDKAASFPSPNLEIEANDVRCTHGASIGKVDAEQLFYLMSRGLSRDLATKMIVEGFFEEVLQREPAAAIRDNLRDSIRQKIEQQSSLRVA